jgi:hypothetical protein
MLHESQELTSLRNARHQLTGAWEYTELEIDDLDVSVLLESIRQLSTLINVVVDKIDTEVSRLEKRDSNIFSEHTCSSCEGDKIYVCNDCLTQMAKEIC